VDSLGHQTDIPDPGQPDERSAKRGAARLRPLDRCAQTGARPAHVRQVYQTGYGLRLCLKWKTILRQVCQTGHGLHMLDRCTKRGTACAFVLSGRPFLRQVCQTGHCLRSSSLNGGTIQRPRTSNGTTPAWTSGAQTGAPTLQDSSGRSASPNGGILTIKTGAPNGARPAHIVPKRGDSPVTRGVKRDTTCLDFRGSSGSPKPLPDPSGGPPTVL
jgi:hypothetical protein